MNEFNLNIKILKSKPEISTNSYTMNKFCSNPGATVTQYYGNTIGCSAKTLNCAITVSKPNDIK